MGFPVVRSETGAILGIDWRQVPGMGLSTVPGVIDVRDVMPGDGITVEGVPVTVIRVLGHGGRRSAAGMHILTRTAGGADIVHEAALGEQVTVHSVGAFEPEAAR